MEQQKDCKSCGAANLTSTSFCTKCGKAFASASASPLPPPSAAKEKRSPVWLRILEISAGLIVLILGIAAFYPGVEWGWTHFIAFLAIALIILEIAYIIRIFAKGISGLRRLNVILSVLATLIAVWVLALSFYVSFYGFFLPVTDLLALGVVVAGIASAARGTVGDTIVGIFGIFVGIFVLIFLKIASILAIFIYVALLVSSNLTYPVNVAALVTLSLMIFALEPIISGIMGRWI
ncbi:MAG: hypothetical protein WCE82_07740 [Halobacteriota archaeon]